MVVHSAKANEISQNLLFYAQFTPSTRRDETVLLCYVELGGVNCALCR